ncbi:hypothetical protein [Aliagarivorans taiwanensis]|uniref:hypothetical protein n=1 Tax=Aliagarivorans taiwanensis TaxID=561966 RepID=UPI00047A4C7E|nr:hypothetical protein [Aliagarivorans taiwanensis]
MEKLTEKQKELLLAIYHGRVQSGHLDGVRQIHEGTYNSLHSKGFILRDYELSHDGKKAAEAIDPPISATILRGEREAVVELLEFTSTFTAVKREQSRHELKGCFEKIWGEAPAQVLFSDEV